MKVRIVKCTIPLYWYKYQLNSEFNVVDKGGDMFHIKDLEDEGWGILKQDCEILEADEPKSEPFDLERALKGDKVITTLGRNVTEVVKLNTVKGVDKIAAVIEGVAFFFSEEGTTMYLNGEHLKMAPREPEYQTVWVNLINEPPPGLKVGLFTHHATISKQESLELLEPNDNVIGTFPITFKKP